MKKKLMGDALMIHFDFQHCFGGGRWNVGVSQAAFEASSKNLVPFLGKVRTRGQGFYDIFEDDSVVSSIDAYKRQMEGTFDDVVVLGIGGSALGAMALRDGLGGLFSSAGPSLYVLENIDPDFVVGLLSRLNLKRTLFLVVSKSGKTVETFSQYLFFRDQVERSGGLVFKHFVFVTDSEGGLLCEIARKDQIPVFSIPVNVGGRFSVLTNVGLLPAALMGVNIEALLEGAREMRDLFLSDRFEENLSFQLATIQYLSFQKGRSIHVLMPYASRLKSFTAWWAQLLAESTGKINDQGVSTGMTPLPALGVTDQHSLLQLLMQGPDDKFTLFLRVRNFEKDPLIPVGVKHLSIDFLKNVSFSRLLNTACEGTAIALAEGGRSSLTIEVSEISAHTLGALFFLFEGTTAFLGEYLGVDAFDQPGVERSKMLVREKLSSCVD